MTLKAAVLLILTICAMRLASWAVGWTLGRIARSTNKPVRAGANLIALGAFAGFLIYDRLPGELLDRSALIFGIGIFAVFTAIDLWWWPWRKRDADEA